MVGSEFNGSDTNKYTVVIKDNNGVDIIYTMNYTDSDISISATDHGLEVGDYSITISSSNKYGTSFDSDAQDITIDGTYITVVPTQSSTSPTESNTDEPGLLSPVQS